ncbi:hypothetical protein [Paracoccus sp. PAMC 22219]|uniref:hypothetical protein n=1 Tax=Paracoccus sp. PAMC 22219 TaxID=1569209 RepID=UPI0005A5D9F2|nr:hypothetical protein [Paracoccus sp. PAMC 22219]
MIELLFVACLSTQPATCQDRSMLFSDEIGLMACTMGAQAHLAQWAARHPHERVARWKCQAVDRSGRAA